MFDFLKRKEGPAERPGRAAPGTEIYYDPVLVVELKQDHQRLLGLYVRIKEQFERGDLAALTEGLEEFRLLLQSHLLTEKIRLYIYLEHALANEPDTIELIRRFKQEMDAIGRDVTSFLRKYEALAVNPSLAGQFHQDLDRIGSILNKRIQAEENQLYALYLPVL
jgi:hypothetical protein